MAENFGEEFKDVKLPQGLGRKIAAIGVVVACFIVLAGSTGMVGAGERGVLLRFGAVTGTSPTIDVKIQESTASGGTYTDISGATFTQVTASNKTQVISFRRSKQYARAYATLGGTTPTGITACNIYQQKKLV